jgi:hypothetical protein
MKTLLAAIMFTTTTLFGADLVLQWQDNSDNEDGFEIWRQQNGGEWLLIAATNADDATFTDGVIPIGTTLAYKVRAWNQFGESDWTNIVSIKTYPPVAPTTLKGAAIKSKGVSFRSSPNGDSPNGDLLTREVRIRTYRDKHGRLVIERS